MKKALATVCLLAIMLTLFCSCAKKTCEHCGESTMTLNLVGDDVNGINVCDTCIEKMRMSKLHFDFTCDDCHNEIVGKKNAVTVGGETKTVCNTCNKNYASAGDQP